MTSYNYSHISLYCPRNKRKRKVKSRKIEQNKIQEFKCTITYIVMIFRRARINDKKRVSEKENDRSFS